MLLKTPVAVVFSGQLSQELNPVLHLLQLCVLLVLAWWWCSSAGCCLSSDLSTMATHTGMSLLLLQSLFSCALKIYGSFLFMPLHTMEYFCFHSDI